MSEEESQEAIRIRVGNRKRKRQIDENRMFFSALFFPLISVF